MRKPDPSVIFALLIAIVAQAVVPSVGICQEKIIERAGASKYYISLGPEDELMMKINVWGNVAKPGQYLVPSSTDLIALLSYAGGPIESARVSDVRIVRTGGKKQAVISVDTLSAYINETDSCSVF